MQSFQLWIYPELKVLRGRFNQLIGLKDQVAVVVPTMSECQPLPGWRKEDVWKKRRKPFKGSEKNLRKTGCEGKRNCWSANGRSVSSKCVTLNAGSTNAENWTGGTETVWSQSANVVNQKDWNGTGGPGARTEVKGKGEGHHKMRVCVALQLMDSHRGQSEMRDLGGEADMLKMLSDRAQCSDRGKCLARSRRHWRTGAAGRDQGGLHPGAEEKMLAGIPFAVQMAKPH